MKQIIQNYKTGELQLAEVPAPQLKRDTLLVRTAASLISVGTERYLTASVLAQAGMLDLAKKSLLGKAMARPDLVKQVINKVRAEGEG